MQDIPFLFYIQSNKKIPMYSRDTKANPPYGKLYRKLDQNSAADQRFYLLSENAPLFITLPLPPPG